jgi:tRNA threonylcarbamoyl adenosine modification protein YjeE
MDKLYTLSDIQQLAREIAQNIKSIPYILGLEGDLGAGKTAFAKEFIKSFDSKAMVTSPTFSIVQYYANNTIAHYDLYRIKHADEFYDLDIFEDMTNKICLIEWPQILGRSIPTLSISIVDDQHRRVVSSLHSVKD